MPPPPTHRPHPPPIQPSPPHPSRSGAFTLVELVISTAILAVILLVLTSLLRSVSDTWIAGERRTGSFQNARGALEMITRELTPAVVDTRMQFALVPASTLTAEFPDIPPLAPGSPALFWMAPLGPGGELRCVGYYLARDGDRQLYQLKRLFVQALLPDSDPPQRHPLFPAMFQLSGRGLIEGNWQASRDLRTSPTDASWFFRHWSASTFDDEDPANADAATSTVADDVIALWIQPLDLLGNPVPWMSSSTIHPEGPYPMIFNSAAYMQFATSTAFVPASEDAPPISTAYLRDFPQAMKANRIPAAIDITLVTINRFEIDRGLPIPTQSSPLTPRGTLDLEQAIATFEAALLEVGIRSAQTFTTQVKLLNGT